jgi:hypothetical protein
MSRLKKKYEWGCRWRFEERGGAVLRCVSLAMGLGRLILGMACVFCWMLGVWVCVQTDGSRHLAATIVVRVPALLSLGSSFLSHCSARVLRGFVCVDDIPPCVPRPWRWRSREKKTKKRQKKSNQRDIPSRLLSSITFLSLTMIRILDMILNASTVN